MSEKIILPKGIIIPNHIAIVLDGNRRWARSKGLTTLEGHRRGFNASMKIAEATRNWGVHTFTVWGFSTENWERAPEEVSYLMKLYSKMLDVVKKEAIKNDIKFVHLGRKDRLPKGLVKNITKLEDETKNNKRHIFNVAIDYGGKDEIIRTTKKIIKAGIKAEDLNENLFASYLDTKDQPYPYVDLFIRTSGEQRTSGLLPWQASYAEFYFEPEHLPDFTPEKLRLAILDFSRRRRRFGGDDEVKHLTFNPKITARLELALWKLRDFSQGEKFSDHAVKLLKEQFGFSKELAKDASKLYLQALSEEKNEKLDKAIEKTSLLYQMIKNELKLSFEPNLVASLEIEMNKQLNRRGNIVDASEAEKTAKELYAEIYRISLFQATKAAHLRVLAITERNMAESGMGEIHWKKAKDYLEKHYQALKERVA